MKSTRDDISRGVAECAAHRTVYQLSDVQATRIRQVLQGEEMPRDSVEDEEILSWLAPQSNSQTADILEASLNDCRKE